MENAEDARQKVGLPSAERAVRLARQFPFDATQLVIDEQSAHVTCDGFRLFIDHLKQATQMTLADLGG